ncbi:MAG: NFACT family protein [Candidatus Woesearchaeota archaeon]|jgi:predicted ribosome quality control (RQC) complex YloA/Tae2 family protein
MKQQLAGIELLRVVKELQVLKGGKINQIYVDREKKEMLFEIYVSNQGRQLLRIIFPSFIFLASVKPESPTKPDGYCLYLRKYLKNSRVLNIEQMGAERILCITVEAHDITKTEYVPVIYKMYIELFSKGNFIFTNEQDMILSPLEIQEWSGRFIKAKEQYIYPRQEYNVFKMSEKDFEKALKQSDKDTLVTTLAVNFGLGGTYAEEICERAGVQKNIKPAEEGKKVYAGFQNMLHDIQNGTAVIVLNNTVQEDVFPCSLKKYPLTHPYISFMEALDYYFSPLVMQKEKKEQISKQDKIKVKLMTMIASQEKQIVVCQKEYERNQELGEKIYHNYQVIDEIFKKFEEARRTKSWDEIKKSIKNSKYIKGINEKDKEITIDI